MRRERKEEEGGGRRRKGEEEGEGEGRGEGGIMVEYDVPGYLSFTGGCVLKQQ
jgi:hypothetical protein